MNADLRLAGAVAGAWAAALGCLYGTAWSDLAVTAGLVVLALAVGCAPWPGRAPSAHRPGRATGISRPGRVARVRAVRWIALAVLLGAVCAAAVTTARVAVRDAGPLPGLARRHARVTLRLVVADDPRPTRSGAAGPPAFVVAADAERLSGTGVPDTDLHVRVLVLASGSGWADILPGTTVVATGRLQPARGGDLTAAVLSTSAAPRPAGGPPWVQRVAGAVRAGLRRACAGLPPAPGGLLPGLVDGDTSRLDPVVAADFRATGMVHLLAVSGTNVAIVFSVVLLVARWCRAGPRLAAGVCALALAGFVVLVRPSPSVLRAAVMGGAGLLALVLGRPRAAVPALAGATLLLLLVDPALAGRPGFALSVLATSGLLLIAPVLREALRRRGVPPRFAEALAVPVAAHLACVPLIAGMSGTVSLAAIPANLFAEPAVAPATILGVLAAVASVGWPAGAAFLAWLGSWPARWLVTVARYGADLPGGTVAWPGGTLGGLLLAAVLVGFLVAARRRTVRIVAVVSALAIAVGAVPVRLVAAGWPPPGALVVACDVGQGDAIVLPLSRRTAVMVDAGPEPVAVDRCLRELGVAEVVVLVVSHFHADHVGGVAGVYRGRRVDAIVAGDYTEPRAGYAEVVSQARAHHTPMLTVGRGWTWSGGPLKLTVIGPVGRLTGTDSDPNNNSLVLLAQHGGVRILLPGDAEIQEQQAVLSADGPDAVRADVLKVPHHGSAYQDPDFLHAVRARAALVSVGAGNSYGHPSAVTIGRLHRAGTRVLRTDLDGDVAVLLDGAGLATVRHGREAGRHPP